MIALQRKLVIRVKDAVCDKGDAPKGILKGQYYPVVGYQVHKRLRKFGDSQVEKEVEEISVFIVLNQKQELSFVYPSYCEINLDIYAEEIASSQLVKEPV
jgi:hypothetical protein